MVLRNIIENVFLIPHKTLFCITTDLFTSFTHIQHNDIPPATSHKCNSHTVTNKSTPLTADTFLCCTKIVFPIDDFLFLFHRKKIILAVTLPPSSHLTSCTPTKSNLYLANCLAAAVSEPAPYRPLTFHVQNHVPFPLFGSYRKSSSGPSHMFPFRKKDSFFTVRSC